MIQSTMMQGSVVQELWLELGALGFLIVGMAIALVYLAKGSERLAKDQAAERKEWRKEAQGQTNKMIDVVESNTSIMTELSTLIKGRK